MNTNHDELERLLGDELRDRAGDMSGAGLQLTDVRGRASSIRRRRRVAAGVGVAAALAVIVPTAITAGGSTLRSTDPDPAPPVHEVVRTTLTLDGLQRGDAPGVEYFTADGVVLPDEGLQPLDMSYQALVPSPADDGWLALSPSRDVVATFDQNFDQTDAEPTSQVFVSNPDRSLVAWTAPGAEQVLRVHSTVDPDADLSWPFSTQDQVVPVDFLPDDSLLYQVVDSGSGESTIGIARPDGTTSEFEGNFVKAIAASPETGLVAVQTRSKRDASGCFGVVDPRVSTASTLWESCDHALGPFSPDGRYLLASDAQQSGFGPTSADILDAATGDLVASFRPGPDTQIGFGGLVWESSDSVLGIAVEGTENAIVRMGVDGTLEDTVDREPTAGDQPFWLSEDRRRTF